MRKVLLIIVLVVVVVGIFIGGYFLWEQVTRVSKAELQQTIQQDGVPFTPPSIPAELIDQIDSNRVVVVGEFHFLREHREFIAALIGELHALGFRQYLFEWTQAADWLLSDFVNDGRLVPEWTPPHDIGGDAITAVRNLNRTLPEDERIQVHGIDITLQDYGGMDTFLTSIEMLAVHLADPGPLSSFLDGEHDSEENHRRQLETLQTELDDQRAALISSWGEYFYNTIYEMVEVELKAIPVRATRESDYDESVRLREEAIKWLVDRRIGASKIGTLINIGLTHSQKEGILGTEDIEWLGDYLIHQSDAADGSAMTMWVAAQHIVSVPASDDPDFDLTDSPENELLRVTAQIWPNKAVFLPFDDSLFSEARIPVNFSGDIYVTAPKKQHDAVVLLPIAHRDFVGD